MRWKEKRTPNDRETRTITWFAWSSVEINGEHRWLEIVKVKQWYSARFERWFNDSFDDSQSADVTTHN